MPDIFKLRKLQILLVSRAASKHVRGAPANGI